MGDRLRLGQAHRTSRTGWARAGRRPSRLPARPRARKEGSFIPHDRSLTWAPKRSRRRGRHARAGGGAGRRPRRLRGTSRRNGGAGVIARDRATRPATVLRPALGQSRSHGDSQPFSTGRPQGTGRPEGNGRPGVDALTDRAKRGDGRADRHGRPTDGGAASSSGPSAVRDRPLPQGRLRLAGDEGLLHPGVDDHDDEHHQPWREPVGAVTQGALQARPEALDLEARQRRCGGGGMGPRPEPAGLRAVHRARRANSSGGDQDGGEGPAGDGASGRTDGLARRPLVGHVRVPGHRGSRVD